MKEADICECGHPKNLHIMGGACIVIQPSFCYCTRFESVHEKLMNLGQRKVYRL